MNLIASFNQENVTEDEAKLFRHRRAVRAVVFDSDNRITLLREENGRYYSLPGGGVNIQETYEQGAQRECREEIGCDVEITQYLGTTLEYRKEDNVLNESSGYTAKVVGNKKSPLLVGDEDEAEKNSLVVWVSLDEAIQLMEALPTQVDLYAQYCVERDLIFLHSAQKVS